MENIEIIIPTIEQINNSEIFSAYGKKATVTDFAALQGSFVSKYLKQNNKKLVLK